MNGAESGADGEFLRHEEQEDVKKKKLELRVATRQLLTPTVTPSGTPEPDDVADPAMYGVFEDKGKSTIGLGLPRSVMVTNGDNNKTDKEGEKERDDTAPLSVSSTSRRTSINEEFAPSDSSERTNSRTTAPPPQIKRPGDAARRRSSVSEHERLLKLSPKQMHELTTEPASIPIRAATPILEDATEDEEHEGEEHDRSARRGNSRVLGLVLEPAVEMDGDAGSVRKRRASVKGGAEGKSAEKEIVVLKQRPGLSSRSTTTPPVMRRKQSSSRTRGQGTVYEGGEEREKDRERERRSSRHVPPPLSLEHKESSSLKPPPSERHREGREPRDVRDAPSPMPPAIPLPPMSMPTFLSLELSADRPSPLYIYRPSTADFPYESSKIKYERLVNFLKIPYKVEGILGFGALACLDAWMHVLTILPLRFLFALAILIKWWGSVVIKEAWDIWNFVRSGLPRVWRRRRATDAPTPVLGPRADDESIAKSSRRQSISAASSPNPSARENGNAVPTFQFPETKDPPSRRSRSSRYRHRRTKSTPSALLPSHKADILKGLLVITSCAVLMRFDASRMYHGIRGQSAIKLYVIYNVLEVCDRLLSAVGQDVLECLFSRETLDRNPDGRSKVIQPFWMFLLALVYNVAHATALFYQVVTLNVAVNSYSNALLTLLLSNQFVEIKGTVFKKFEKENLFQLTVADVVERFQLWLMLLIIAMRNIVEVGGLSIGSGESSFFAAFTTGTANATGATSAPFTASSILPMSFTIFPKWIAQVLNPFLLVLGSEMAVDWLKHAYITKFNQTKPEVYGKFLDVLAKDYYSNAFADPNLTRRLGLPVIPLSCLFIRAAIQTYHMFIATHMPLPFPGTTTTSTSLTDLPPTSSPATTAALAHIDHIFRRALGRSSFGAGLLLDPSSARYNPWYRPSSWSLDDLIAASTMLLVFLLAYLVFLAFKLVLGMLLLRLARNRYYGMKERERESADTGGKRIGGWGVVDVDEDMRRWIYEGDREGLRGAREREEKARRKEAEEREKERVGGGGAFGGVSRYAMVAKRIW